MKVLKDRCVELLKKYKIKITNIREKLDIVPTEINERK